MVCSMLLKNFLLGLGYFLGGYVGDLIVIPPSHASPIWPAAGIALAGLIVYGWRVLPGIWLGAVLIQTYAFLDSSSSAALFNSLLSGVVISVAAVAQALSGAWLVRRYVGSDHALVKDGDILRFLGLAGPVSCTVCATLGIAALYWQGVIGLGDMLFSWLTWWSGDTIGVLIFSLILLCFIGEPRPQWRTRINSVALPLVVLLLIVAALFYLAKNQEEKRITTLFDERVNLLHHAMQNEFDRVVDTGLTLKALFDSTSPVDQTGFNRFARTILEVHGNIQALEWTPRVAGVDRAAYEQSLGSGFSIRVPDARRNLQPAPLKDEYFPITYIEPLAGNERAFGYDISSNSLIRESIQAARRSGQTTMTKRIRLIQDQQDYPGVVIYTPVYWGGSTSVDDQAFRGFVAVVLVVGNKIDEVKSQFAYLQLALNVVDGDTELYKGIHSRPGLDQGVLKLEKSLTLKIADRQWRITYRAMPEFFASVVSWSIWWLVLGSLLLVSLIGYGLLMLTGRTLQIEGIIMQRTLELETEIAERKRILCRRNDHNQVLQAIVSGVSLPEVLQLIAGIAEQIYPSHLCSILLLDDSRQRLRLGAAPSLPQYFIDAIDGAAIGNGAGSCGTAAYLGERVIVEEIGKHVFWRGHAGLAKRAGLASCWAEPIFSSKHEVLGTFALYHPAPYSPDADMCDEVRELAQLASIAIEKKQTEEQISRLAFFDALTGLPNRRLFLDRLEQAIAQAMRNHAGSALLYLDLDHFKTLNDALGHDIGDELLVQVASRLKLCVRDEDTVARLGGDEFVLLLTGQETSFSLFDHALTVAERVQAALLAPYHLKGYIHHISSSIGVTLLEKCALTQKKPAQGELLKQADTAMYHAKQRGRNAISFYNRDMQLRADQRLSLERDLRGALSDGQFCLHYQPQFDDQERLIGAEALLRWRHPSQGTMSPSDFIPVAEETGLILAIGEWVLREACGQLQKWPGLPHLAVNICPKEFHLGRFEDNITAILAECQVAPERLMLEITEGIIIDNVHESIEKLKALKSLGIEISIDDFGTGYSSLSYLKVLPLSQLKIDQSFVRDITVDPNDAVIVETIISMARHLGLTVIAEGVETAAQLQFLHDKRCKGFQGYFFSKPLSEDEFAALYAERIFDVADSSQTTV